MAAKRECRLRLRKGEPVSYYMHTCITFLDLSRELRDRIYNEALITPNPITVCSMTVNIDCHGGLLESAYYKDDEGRMTHNEIYTVALKDTVFSQLALGLLCTSRIIASEAAAVLYRFNKFHFGGTEIWNPLYGFLDLIGPKNRASLRDISVELDKPPCLPIDCQGVRTLGYVYDFRFRKVVSCGQKKEEHEVYFVDPAIEACFRILGMAGAQVQLRLLLAPSFLPGVNVWEDDPNGYDSNLRPWYSLDILQNIERFRKVFASNVDVLWFGVGRKDMFDKHTKGIREKGWEVLETKDQHYASTLYNYWKTYFVVRRICDSTLGNTRGWSIDRVIEQYGSIKWPVKESYN